MRLSANLGFLWRDRPLPDGIRAAKRAGFDAVECHWPFGTPADDVKRALDETGLTMLSLNTWPGDPDNGDFGLCALPAREAEARAAIGEAIDYATAIGCGAVHVMGGKSGGGREADAVFRANLDFACESAAPRGIAILIEPINTGDVPGYHLSSIDKAAEMIAAPGHANLKIMADCYHLHRMGEDVIDAIRRHLPLIGHIQIAAAPDRGEPDRGEIDYADVAAALRDMGYSGYLGAEYRPRGDTDAGLGWMSGFRAGSRP